MTDHNLIANGQPGTNPPLQSVGDPVPVGKGGQHPPLRRSPWIRRCLITFLVLAITATTFWIFRNPILIGLARLWTVNDTPKTADAIIVLGGGLVTRPFAAADLYKKQLAPKVLIAETHTTPPSDIGVVSRETDASRNVLLKLGVPETAIVTFGKDVTSTHEEACALRDWLLLNKVSRIIVPTDFLHSRRVSWLMRHILPAEAEISIVATPSLYFDQTNWWTREEGVISFQNEVIKNIYYRLKY